MEGLAAAIVGREIGDFAVHEEACRTLIKMGPVAEEAAIAMVPSNDEEICLSALQILSFVGTEQSKSILRQAMRSSNPEVKRAASATMKTIQQRIKGESEQRSRPAA